MKRAPHCGVGRWPRTTYLPTSTTDGADEAVLDGAMITALRGLLTMEPRYIQFPTTCGIAPCSEVDCRATQDVAHIAGVYRGCIVG